MLRVRTSVAAAAMAFQDATTILQLVMTLTWMCLYTTPTKMKNPLYATFFGGFDILNEIGSAASLCFAAGLFETLRAVTPPTLEFFKTLPTDVRNRWAVYLIVMEKFESKPQIYIGSATDGANGVSSRFRCYDRGAVLPRYVQKALQNGYNITHKGLLCWSAIPSATLRPVTRLLFVAIEAALAFAFWAMKAEKGDYGGMSQFCPWARDTLPYSGLWSHSALDEGVVGNFDFTAEELEAKAAKLKQRRRKLQVVQKHNWHVRQLATNADAYRAAHTARERVRRSKKLELWTAATKRS